MGYSQSELARRTGVLPACINRIESGVNAPSFDLLVRLKRSLGCHWDALLRGVE